MAVRPEQMNALIDAVRAYTHAPVTDNTFIERITATAAASVEQICGVREIPEAVLTDAVVAWADNLYAKRGQYADITDYGGTGGGYAARAARDPRTLVMPILQPFLGIPIA
ncbi:MAG: hypothetical protein SOS98_03840 [Varibaculum sp.]|nr:hypothetical protein [Varibaculum sp.]